MKKDMESLANLLEEFAYDALDDARVGFNVERNKGKAEAYRLAAMNIRRRTRRDSHETVRAV